MSKSKYVYVVSSPNGYVKIGRANEAHERFYMVQCNSPLELTLSYVCEAPNADQIEKSVHIALAAYRRHGEWFEVSSAVAIEALRQAMFALGLNLSQCAGRAPKVFAGKPRLRALMYENGVA